MKFCQNQQKLLPLKSRFCLLASSLMMVGGAQAQSLPFPVGGNATGTATAPLPALTLLLGYSSTPAIVGAGDWTLSASGSTSLGVEIFPLPRALLGSSQAQTVMDQGNLSFRIATNGLSSLVGASLPMTWSATTTIADSVNWEPQPTGFTYGLDLAINNSVLAGNIDVFSGVSLIIRDGNNNTLFSGTDLPDILGIVDLSPSNTGLGVDFQYDPVNGPLSITWSSNSTVTASLLTDLGGNGTQSMFSINNSQISVTPVPEPSGVLLVGLAGLGLLGRRRRSA